MPRCKVSHIQRFGDGHPVPCEAQDRGWGKEEGRSFMVRGSRDSG